MATKSGNVDKKRKADSGSKMKSADSGSKKARLDGAAKKSAKPQKPVEEEEDDFESFSDSEDGGAPLERSHKFDASKAGDNAKNFERTSGETSRESHIKQKKLAAERKAAKPLADEVQRSKKIWERLRRKSHVPKEERQKLVEELFEIITGRMKDFVLKHDAVRAVQTAIKYSTPEQRKMIAQELQGTYAQLAESRYAKFLIGKLMVAGDKETRDLIIPEFYGKVRKLINHPEASWILDDIYRQVASKEQKATLLREWYGPAFALKEMNKDAAPTADLKEILAKEPSKRGPIMKSLGEMINSLIQKSMTGFTMLHDAMLQNFLCMEPGSEEFKEFIELVKGDEAGDLLKNLAFTPSGARLVCLLFAHGTPKDRKVFIKTYKETYLMMSGDQHAHTVILTAYDVIDDTKMVAKAIFPELLGEDVESRTMNVVAAANNTEARKTVLYLTQGLAKSLFPTKTAFDYEVLEEIREIRKTTSKKDDDLRQKELLEALSPQLLEAIATAPADLTATPLGCQFVADILLFGIGDKTAALEALAEIAKGAPAQEPSEDDIAPPTVHISQTTFGARMLKSLIQGGKFDKQTGKVVPCDPPLNFSNILYPAIKDHIVAWATTSSSFVVVGLLESADFEHADSLRRTLKKNKAELQKAAKEETAAQKLAKEGAVAEQKPGKGGKAKKDKGERPVGNMGSKLLLEKL
ncbi:ARM repeat-containing protein [Sarocladium strictum]